MRRTAHGSGLGRWRWVVERTFAWLNQFRRLRVRYDKRENGGGASCEVDWPVARVRPFNWLEELKQRVPTRCLSSRKRMKIARLFARMLPARAARSI